MIKLSSQDSNKHVGIMPVPELATLMRDFPVRLSAKLLPPDGKSEHSPWLERGEALKLTLPQEFVVRIVVCGLLNHGTTVGDLLAKAGLYLQPPFINEFNRALKYMNPHWLLRPGSEMPTLAETESSDDPQAIMGSDIMNEARKCQFMRLFDAANDGHARPMVRPSPRLSAVLTDHQLSALARMAETERGIIVGAGFPSLWEEVRSSGATMRKKFRSKITGQVEEAPRPPLGGILADVSQLDHFHF
jgi:hypothetical protein